MRTLFWSWSLRLHFSTAERDVLLCACLNDGAGKTGIRHLCTRLYGRSIEELTEPELAGLVVASRSPSRFLNNPELLAKFSAELLRRVKAS
ncbi:hypothetical protein [Prosthecobacter sp.]|uniref:hypothetical protein n=1 Tax=Prosthecobacter sp. TaxID=1965333 RepID=UPI0037838846